MAPEIRPEAAADVSAIRAVNLAAFGGPAEADLVEALRKEAQPFISLVAVLGRSVVGHIAFSPVTLDGVAGPDDWMGLAPMAVLPAHQRQGIGSALVRAGLRACERAGRSVVVVLGHRDYYPRFGFRTAARVGLRSEYPVPDEHFMVLELAPGALAGRTGLVRYHAAFAGF